MDKNLKEDFKFALILVIALCCIIFIAVQFGKLFDTYNNHNTGIVDNRNVCCNCCNYSSRDTVWIECCNCKE